MFRRFAPLLLAPAVLAAAPAGDRVEQLRRSLVQAGQAEQAGRRGAETARRRLARLNAEEAALLSRVEANRESLTRLLSALQRFSTDPPPALIVSPREAKDAVRAAILIRAITPQLQARGRAFAAEAQALARARRAAAVQGEALFEAESAVADQGDAIARLGREKRALELAAGGDAADPLLAARAAGARGVDDLLSIAPSTPAPTLPARPPGRLLSPVEGPRTAQADGLSYNAAAGAPVLSPAGGRIDYAGPLKGWGQLVIVRLSPEHRLVLAGLGELQVGAGRAVAAGEPLGRMPAGGQGAELYVELRRGARALSPANWAPAPPRG